MTTEQRYRCITCNQELTEGEQHTCRRQRIEVCGFCQRQITAPHDCPERRRVEAELAELGRVPTVATTLHGEATTTNGRD